MLLFTYQLSAQRIDLDIIAKIESSGNTYAHNKTDGGSRGMYQISPICLKDYNQINDTNYELKDLFNLDVNRKIASWYFEVRIPYMLKRNNIKVTLENKIISYNAGIRYLINNEPIPTSTRNYIEKYKNLSAPK
jgi:hypothetical protein